MTEQTIPTIPAQPRTHEERLKDTLARFENDVDVWVATADADGVPCMVPLSFLRDGETFLVSTQRTNPTARNLIANGRARLAFGPTRDVVLVEGTATTVEAADLAPAVREAFAARTGFDPSAFATPYPYFRITPVWIQAWREVNEMAGRQLMTDGHWIP
ncbi:pyridoxamine 5'-phosphate oxidase family protein [Streptomyces sp. NPDC090045]|uniref:pyridoxamine 5'-phosphate oxidase family protein n=1 Tax=Streptomyces sp. NPDC090045 TaxID=3365927 RepID=UPI0037FEDDD6